jgi:ERCC4-type nuclease
MTFHIILDSRERTSEVLTLFEEFYKSDKFDFTYEIQELAVGDVVMPSHSIVFERKQEDDFVNSFIDKEKHLEIQLFNMNKFFGKRFLFIVGDLDRIHKRLEKNAFIGKRMRIFLSYETSIDYFECSRDYVYAVLEVCKFAEENKALVEPKVYSKSSMTMEERLINAIAGVDGFGEERAKTLIKDFGITCFQDFAFLTEDRYNQLRDGGKCEKIGPKTIKELIKLKNA